MRLLYFFSQYHNIYNKEKVNILSPGLMHAICCLLDADIRLPAEVWGFEEMLL